MGAIVLAFVFNIIPIVILPVFYQRIPDIIPAFVDLLGSPVVSIEKSYLAILRLPAMGVQLSIICLIMYKTKFDGEHKRLNQIIWRAAACIAALKMGITSMEIMFYEKLEIIKYFRIAVFILTIIGIIVLISGLIKMYKTKAAFTEYKKVLTINKILIVCVLGLYVIIALMPLFNKGTSKN
jgi:hypothetical protein